MQTYFTIIISFLGLLSTALYFVIKRKDEELNRIRQKVSDKKHDTYSETIEIYFELLKENKGLKTVDNDQLKQRYIDIKKNILLFASDQVIFKFFDFEKCTDYLKVYKYCELIVAMRKDMGNDKTKLNAKAMLRTLITDEEEYQKFIKQIPQANFSKKQLDQDQKQLQSGMTQ